MRRFALPVLSLVLTCAALVALAPLSNAVVPSSYQSGAAQVNNGGIFDQIDSLLNNFTKRFDLNSLFPQQTTTPSVNITSVKTVGTGQSTAAPQVIVAVQNGKVALDGVKIDISYKNSVGTNVQSNSTVIALKADETRSITFNPQGLSAGSYVVGVVVYKNGTDPSNRATPPYDVQQSAATLTIASLASPTAAGKADEGIQASNIGDILSLLSPWTYFIIAMTVLITVALFFVFSQNRSGEDRFEDDHFKGDDYFAGERNAYDPSALDSAFPTVDHRSNGGRNSKPRQSRKIEVTTPQTSDDAGVSKQNDPKSSTEHAVQFDADGFVVGDVTSKKALRNKMRGKKGA